MSTCTHVDEVVAVEPETRDGCPECLEAGSTWVHLRSCLSCGHVGCCDSSPNQHATSHVRDSDHVLVQSIEPGEHWAYCYADEVVIPGLTSRARSRPGDG